MPVMDGWEVCARLRELSDIPIILLTAKSSEADKLRGFQLGVDDYMTKPFSFAELTARIQAVLGRTRRPAAQNERNLLFFGDFTLDLDKREARRGRRGDHAHPHRIPPVGYSGAQQGPGHFRRGAEPASLGRLLPGRALRRAPLHLDVAPEI